ncbi:MAG TPA: serine/threonine-protein kinase [Gaiella sp.]|nr:serine/threonine-protein kinase [Gaiella sp.]
MSNTAFALPDRTLVLDRYRPLKPLGRGGSGSVWLSHDERTGLEVALKIVPREGKRAARASREMEAASRLRHERCVRAYDFGGDAGHVYIAYEYVRGRTLRETLRTDGLEDAAAVEIAAQVLDGLAHAHRRGIVHRDVKPSNVLVEEGEALSIRVLDFGLAQFDEADTLTAVGDVPGTLAYISPERLSGAEATERSDVWAVGVILWEALAGSHPFWGVPLPQVASTIAAGAPPLSARRPDLPRRLIAAVDAALAVDAAKRPSATRLASELREAYVARPSQRREPRRTAARRARPAPRARRTAPAVPLGRRLPSAGLAAVATLVGGSLLPFWPPALLALVALAAGAATLRSPRLGLAIALAAPVFPLANVAQAAAVVYGVLALAWLAVSWREPRTGLAFCAGPLLAAVGLIALLPLAVQVVPQVWRRALHAALGVLAAAAVTGLSGHPLPLTGVAVGDLGVAGTERPTDVLHALGTVLSGSPGLATTALALAIVAVLLPRAAARGPWGIAGLGALQLVLVLVWAPAIAATGIVVGTWLLCGILAARPYVAVAVRPLLVAAAQRARNDG